MWLFIIIFKGAEGAPPNNRDRHALVVFLYSCVCSFEVCEGEISLSEFFMGEISLSEFLMHAC